MQVPLDAIASRAQKELHHNDIQGRVVLGARVEDACRGPAEYADALRMLGDRPFALTYRPETQRAYVMLKEGASGTDALCGAFHAHVLLHIMDAMVEKAALPVLEVLPKSEPVMPPGKLAKQHPDCLERS